MSRIFSQKGLQGLAWERPHSDGEQTGHPHGGEGELDVTEPKTKNSVRNVALSQQAVDLLVQEHEQHPDTPSYSRRLGQAATGVRTPCRESTGSC